MTRTHALRGAFTALVTPFTPDGELDIPAFTGLVERQIEARIDGLVPCGTTGESPTLSPEERDRLIDITVETVRTRGATDASPSSLAPARTTRGPPSRPRAGRPSWAPMRPSWWRPTTTARTSACWSPTTWP
jgi:4-hydroxy-tetrahydrodipicolinate synthase